MIMRLILTIMLRFTLALTLLTTATGGIFAQDAAPKTVQGQAIIHDLGCQNAPCDGSTWQVEFSWGAAQPPPDGYRLDYAINGKWQSHKRANTPSKGTVYISSAEHKRTGGYSLSGIHAPYGKKICFRLKTRYQGEKDGPWTKLCLSN